jgi:hypothetical protein
MDVLMKKICGIIICILTVILSCATAEPPIPESDVTMPSVSIEEVVPVPEGPIEEDTPLLEKIIVEKPVEEEIFDPSSITQEVFDTAKADVQELIQQLNQIIRNKDYMSWRSYLGQTYLDAISDSDFLSRLSASARLKTQNIVLRGPGDYFLYVVVPSRANDRVDDIEFVGTNQVKAFTITPKGQRLRLYNLEKKNGHWKIIE